MSKAKQKGKPQRPRKLVVSAAVAAGVLVVAFGVGIGISWLQHGTGNGPTGGSSGSTTAGSADVAGLPTTPLPNSIVTAQNLASQGKYDQAQQSIAQSIAATNDSTEKYDLYLEEGVTYMNQQQYANAIAAYNNAKAIKETAAVYQAIGDAQAAAGQDQAAIASYNKAISLLGGDQRAASHKQTIENEIQELSK